MQPHTSVVVAVAAALCALLLLGSAGPGAAAPHPCDPDNLMVAPSQLREMCAALYKLSSAMQVYLEDRVEPDMAKRRPAERPEHVFLRFGRRR
ncbi:hypothetical protein R5R35_008773 [Gryllus longicercus]|uniref:Myosuppressin n=1 Tax=Gryllus longicercus TaxID=2509291 RepID=A0AAN9ZFH2_9ORTH